MNKLYSSIGCVLLLSLAIGCDYVGLNSTVNEGIRRENAVARVGNSYLMKNDLNGLISTDMSSEDSLRITRAYIDNWVKKELVIKEASNNLNLNQAEIEQKVANYRYQLLAYEFQKLYIESQLNKEVTPDEVSAYYEENIENFTLRQNIVKGRYIKLSKDAPKKADVRRWIKSERAIDLENLNSYCFQFASNYSLDSTWINFDEVIKNSPFSTISNKVQFLRRNRYVEESDSSYLYLFRIDEYKISDETSPLEFVREDIENIIINKRKVMLAKNLENDVYTRARENEDFEIY